MSMVQHCSPSTRLGAVEDGVLLAVRADDAQAAPSGNFNDWNPGWTPMIPLRDGSFRVKLPLGPGKHRYRYVIDRRWEGDPANQLCERNPYGELDSVVMV